jgi:hypothetical protein
MPARPVESPPPLTAREGLLVTLAMLAVIGAQLFSVDALYLFSKYFWLDELYTFAVVADPEIGHAWRAMRSGMDSMPLHQFVLRALGSFAAPSEILFRAVSLGSVVLALSGIYMLLRRGVAPLAASTAILAIWAHPVIRTNAFDARFYGPFLAASVWFCYAIERRHAAPRSARTAIGLAVASLALCAIHVFGVLVWPAAVGAAALVYRRWRPWWPALLGPACFPLLWILFLQPQRDAVTIPTWEAAFTWTRVAATLRDVFPEYLLALLALTWGAIWIQRRLFFAQSAPPSVSPPAPALLLLTSLGLLIPLLVGLSLVLQPTLTNRYFIPAIAALAPAVAYSLARLPRWGCWVVLAAMIVVSTLGLRRNAIEARAQDQRTGAVMREIREVPGDQVVVFEVPHVVAVIWHYAPDLRDRIALLDFETGQLPYPSRIRVVTRDLARVYARFYEGPRQVSWDRVGSDREFYLMRDFRAWAADAPPPTPGTRYPGFTIAPVGVHIAKATRR